MIVEQTYALLKDRYIGQVRGLTIEEVRIGIYMTAVRLSDNSYGVAGTLAESTHHCIKSDRDFGAFSPLRIAGQSVLELLESTKPSNTILTLKIAVLNAISSGLIASGKYRILENCDPIELIDLNPRKKVTIVGAFHSYIQRISQTDNTLHVLELNEQALTPEHKQFYVPAKEYPRILRDSDIVIITGLTLVNNTIDGLLSAINDRATVIVTGPSSSVIPDVLFSNKVSIIGATRITDPSLLLNLVSEGGTGYHMFNYCAQKICILNPA